MTSDHYNPYKLPRRKHNELSLDKKRDVLKDLEGMTQEAVAQKWDIHPSTVSRIRTNRNKIQLAIQSPLPDTRKRLRRGRIPLLDEALYQWFTQAQARREPVTTSTLLLKAQSIYTTLRAIDPDKTPTTFGFSNGWMLRWKRRYGLLHLRLDEVDSPTSEFTQRGSGEPEATRPNNEIPVSEVDIVTRLVRALATNMEAARQEGTPTTVHSSPEPLTSPDFPSFVFSAEGDAQEMF